MKTNGFWGIIFVLGLCLIGGFGAFGDQSASLREIQIHLSVGEAAPAGAALLAFRPNFGLVTIQSQRRMSGNLPRERNPELSEDQLVIAALNGRGDEALRIIIPDPRLLRAETSDESGRLSQKLLYRAAVDFSVALPDDPALESIKIFQPQWTGAEFILVPIGEARLR